MRKLDHQENKVYSINSSADFDANFDLVTEQDLKNVHNSTKFVIERARSDLIRNVVKNLKIKQETLSSEFKFSDDYIQAISNYATFYKLNKKDVTPAMIDNSSEGINGWSQTIQENQSNRKREFKSVVLDVKSQDDKDSNQPDENELTNLDQKTNEIQDELVDEII